MTKGTHIKNGINYSGGGGGSANVWEGSHAEYEEEKSQIADETTLLFNDDIGLEAESDYYSEVEQVIGTYLGKPLYRKTWNKNDSLIFTAGQWTDTGISASGIDRYINVDITNMDSASASKWSVDIGTQNGNMVLNYFRNAQLTNWALTVEYTKTTDSVVGVIGGIKKGDNYSTNEQVIGMWFNGKPLYRKSISFTPTPTSQTISLNIDNIDMCVMVPYASYVSYNNVYRNLPYSHTSDGGSISAWISKINGTCDIRFGNDYSGIAFTSGLITVIYTKTTD